jgi:predicted kinase
MKRNLIILNGTCGSGKSTIANELKDYFVINGDDIIREIKEKEGKAPEYNSDIVFFEYQRRMNIGFKQKRKIVINAVFDEFDINKLIKQNSDADIKHIVLLPRLDVAIKRTELRTCFTSITPKYWVEYFHQKMEMLCKANMDIDIIDNSELSIEETKQRVIDLIEKIDDRASPVGRSARCQ